jgi:hypothetical protein
VFLGGNHRHNHAREEIAAIGKDMIPLVAEKMLNPMISERIKFEEIPSGRWRTCKGQNCSNVVDILFQFHSNRINWLINCIEISLNYLGYKSNNHNTTSINQHSQYKE